MHRHCNSRNLAIFLLMIAAGWACYATPLLDVTIMDEPFDADQWRSGDARARGRMVRDLLRSRLLDGKTIAEVVTILGPGDCNRFTVSDVLGYRVDIGYRWGFQPVLYELLVWCPMFKFNDDRVELSLAIRQQAL